MARAVLMAAIMAMVMAPAAMAMDFTAADLASLVRALLGGARGQRQGTPVRRVVFRHNLLRALNSSSGINRFGDLTDEELAEDIYKSKFPKFQPDGEVTEYRPSRKFGEAVAIFPGDKKNPGMVVNFFRSFYYGLTASATIWFAYDDPETNFESIFQFEDVTTDDYSRMLFEHMIKPFLLPSNFFGTLPGTYEFYNPSVAARQLCFGQLPIGLYFENLIRPREIIPISGLYYSQLRKYNPDSATINLDGWKCSSFTPHVFRVWWAEWCEHLFCVSAAVYCEKLNPNYQPAPNELNTIEPPVQSQSGKLIGYMPPRDHPYIGYNAPTIASILNGPPPTGPRPINPQSTQKRKIAIAKTYGRKRSKQTGVSAEKLDIPHMAAVMIDAFKSSGVFVEQSQQGASASAEKRQEKHSVGDSEAPVSAPQENTETLIDQSINEEANASGRPAKNPETSTVGREDERTAEPIIETANIRVDDSSGQFDGTQIPPADIQEQEQVPPVSSRTEDTLGQEHPAVINLDSEGETGSQISNPADDSSRVLALGPLPDDVKARLRSMLPLLDHDIGQLVQGADQIRAIFREISGHLPAELRYKLNRVSFIEFHQDDFMEAQSHLEARAHQEEITNQLREKDSSIAELDDRIQILSSSRADIVSNIDRLKQRRAALMMELHQVDDELAHEERKLSDLPHTIEHMEEKKRTLSREAQALHRRERPILGSADADRQTIDRIDQMRRDAITAIHSLGIV
ncbi:hypothetical protein ACQ4PT_053643 [Festuca glaucescens]